MARLSKVEIGTPCLFCAKECKIGGFWGGDSLISICSNCASKGVLGTLLGDAIADMLISTGVYPPEDADYNTLKSYFENVLLATECSFWEALSKNLLLCSRKLPTLELT